LFFVLLFPFLRLRFVVPLSPLSLFVSIFRFPRIHFSPFSKREYFSSNKERKKQVERESEGSLLLSPLSLRILHSCEISAGSSRVSNSRIHDCLRIQVKVLVVFVQNCSMCLIYSTHELDFGGLWSKFHFRTHKNTKLT
jgi:hypothetical protein